MRSLRITALLLLLSASAAFGKHPHQNWTSFRNGGTSTAMTDLPVQWSPDSGIAWDVELKGYGQSTPVVADGKVFVISVEGNMKDKCVVSCLNADSGKEIWSKSIDAASKAASNYMVARAAPTPAVDDHAIYAFFESGDVLALSHEGDTIWHRNLVEDYGKFENHHGLGSSPAQTAETLFLNIEHDGPSYLIALDKKSGETKWKNSRPSQKSWTSPVVHGEGVNSQVILSSASTVTAYDAKDGKELWNVEGLEGNSVPSPTIAGDMLYIGARIPEFGSARDAAKSNLCLKLADGTTDKPVVVWRAEKAVCDYASPVVVGDYAYYLNKVGVLFCVNRMTGETHYMQRLRTSCWSTPIVSGDKIFFFGKDGATKVVEAGPEFNLVAENQLWDPEHPPTPKTYKEFSGHGGHGHHGGHAAATKPGGEKHGQEKHGSEKKDAKSAGGPPRGGMIQRMLAYDKNKDEKLQEDELPEQFRPMLARVDTNKDKQLDMDELKAMEESFRKRRAGSRESSRDPIVYGVAAADGAFFIRTGTRLFCVK